MDRVTRNALTNDQRLCFITIIHTRCTITGGQLDQVENFQNLFEHMAEQHFRLYLYCCDSRVCQYNPDWVVGELWNLNQICEFLCFGDWVQRRLFKTTLFGLTENCECFFFHLKKQTKKTSKKNSRLSEMYCILTLFK